MSKYVFNGFEQAFALKKNENLEKIKYLEKEIDDYAKTKQQFTSMVERFHQRVAYKNLVNTWEWDEGLDKKDTEMRNNL